MGRDHLGLRRPSEEVNALDVDGRVIDLGFPRAAAWRLMWLIAGPADDPGE